MNPSGPRSTSFPPVPRWKPSFGPDTDDVVKTFGYYVNGERDFVVFKHGTVVMVEDDLSDAQAVEAATLVMGEIFNHHPDMQPTAMDDGNVLVSYNHPAFSIVFDLLASQHWAEIEANHLMALCDSEVLISPAGPNVFDDFGKKALWGRCYFFMDAQELDAVRVVRKGSALQGS